MIQANELRLGNLVNRKFLNPSPKGLQTCFTECKIVSIGIERIIYECKDKSLNKVKFDIISPIPITEEWLLKFGFEWSIQHQAHYLKGFDYVIDVCDGFCRVIKYRRNGENLIDVKYLHELQNLYFVLTGKELIIK